MDKLEHYRQIVKQILLRQAEFSPSHGQIETIPVFSSKTDNYMVVDVGWDQPGRVHAVILHLALRNGKVWVEVDGTEEGITQELLEAGIPKQEIVLAFYRPERRKLTEFAVA
ncbi:MAG: XisI protein [Caldilineaceae bacterium]